MDHKPKVRIGVLGLGPISQAAHMEAVRRAGNTELAAICDVAEDLCKYFAAVHHVPKIYLRYEDMLADPDIDAVVIGTAHEYHIECARMAVAAGKHVLCEKPLGIDLEACELLRQEVSRSGLVFQVGHMKRFDPGIVYAKDAMSRLGPIGAIQAWYCVDIYMHDYCGNVQPLIERSAAVKASPYKQEKDYETYKLLDHCSHLLDTARYLGGEIKALQARHNRVEELSCWQIGIAYANGVIGTLDYSLNIAMDWREGFLVYGKNGSIQAKTYNPWFFKSSEVEVYWAESEKYERPIGFDAHVFKLQMRGFADQILHGGPMQGAAIDDGIAAVRGIAAIKRSAASGQWVELEQMKGKI